MNAVVRIDEKGRITIPRHIRESCGLTEGMEVSLRVEGGRVIIEPVRSRVDELFGIIKVRSWPEDLDSYVIEALRRWLSRCIT